MYIPLVYVALSSAMYLVSPPARFALDPASESISCCASTDGLGCLFGSSVHFMRRAVSRFFERNHLPRLTLPSCVSETSG